MIFLTHEADLQFLPYLHIYLDNLELIILFTLKNKYVCL